MRESEGTANITVIVIVLIGTVAAVGTVLIPRLMANTVYASCCTQSGGKWSSGHCSANRPTTCSNRDRLWTEFEDCVKDNKKNNANEKYLSIDCINS